MSSSPNSLISLLTPSSMFVLFFLYLIMPLFKPPYQRVSLLLTTTKHPRQISLILSSTEVTPTFFLDSQIIHVLTSVLWLWIFVIYWEILPARSENIILCSQLGTIQEERWNAAESQQIYSMDLEIRSCQLSESQTWTYQWMHENQFDYLYIDV